MGASLERKEMAKFMVIFLAALLLTACSLPQNLFFDPPEGQPGYVIPTVGPTQTRPVETATPTTEVQNCAWAWASVPLADETTRVQEALRLGGLIDVEGSAAAYGENCLDVATNQVVRFAVMQTDFYFTVSMDDPSDKEAMGAMAERLLRVVDQFRPGDVPGANLGYLSIRYTNGVQDTNLWLKLDDAKKALDSGLHGETLFDALDQY